MGPIPLFSLSKLRLGHLDITRMKRVMSSYC